MKKVILVSFLFFSVFAMNAQETESDQKAEKKNELKINAFNLIAFEYIDIAYERVLNEESSVGVGLLFGLDNEVLGFNDLTREFSITPYYRQFFGKKYAEGFFVEGFGMLHSGEDEIYLGFNEVTFDDVVRRENFTDVALGLSVGGKFSTERGFLLEVYLGIGRDLLGNSPTEVVGRGGISLGYRF
jgi:hypothetical protein